MVNIIYGPVTGLILLGFCFNALSVVAEPIERIASEQIGITADTALRFGKALGTTAQLWLNLQTDYDVQVAKRDLGKVSIASRP